MLNYSLMIHREKQFLILLKLGIVVYRALDYNLPTSEDCQISHELEELIDFMTSEGKCGYGGTPNEENGDKHKSCAENASDRVVGKYMGEEITDPGTTHHHHGSAHNLIDAKAARLQCTEILGYGGELGVRPASRP
uniref:KIND domain-containing protein n=1 Tax=Anopheles farauti TaxID=69004 RepID=A0A182QPF8_9DIPT